MRMLSSLSIVACLLAAPASAQISGYGGSRPRPAPNDWLKIEAPQPSSAGWRLERIDERIEAARARREISKDMARDFRREARLIGDLRERYGRDGLSESEARELHNRALYLSDAVDLARAKGRKK